MPLSEQTLDFLFQNRMHDSREWFHAHQEPYRTLVREPVLALAAGLEPAMLAIDPLIVTSPQRVISRINRDTRFTHDKSLYREVVWLSFGRAGRERRSVPEFFFQFSAAGWMYGCGSYRTDTKTMDCLRELILEGHRAYRAAERALRAQEAATLRGDKYKRPRYPEQPARKREWLERKSVYVMAESTDAQILFSERLCDTLAAAFEQLAPVYRLLLAADELATERYGAPQARRKG